MDDVSGRVAVITGGGGALGSAIGTGLWLVSPASALVHGIVVPVDGGFSAYSGV